MRSLLVILFLCLASAGRAQGLPEPSYLVVDSAIGTITDFNDLLFPNYVLEDAQVGKKQLQYTFKAGNHIVNCYYNLARNIQVDDPTKITPKYITEVGLEGEGNDLLAIYNIYFGTSTSLSAEKTLTAGRSFTYHGVKFNCTFAPVRDSPAVWRMSITHF